MIVDIASLIIKALQSAPCSAVEEVDDVALLQLEDFAIVARKCGAAKFEEYFQILGFRLMPI